MKKITLILVLILIATTIGSGVSSIAFAAETSFDSTYVLDDLNGSQINGEQFNVVNYGYSKERQAQVLTFAEYGFNYDSSKQNYYGLYVYVYNPSGQAISNGRNSITVATVYEDGKAVDYDKFDLRLLSASKDEYVNLFYKFKLVDVSKILTRVSANTNLRRYDVGEIELNYGKANSEAFTVSNYYEYSGFAKGCGADGNAESNLTCKSNSIETLQLQVNSSYFHYNNGGVKYSNLSSVYFGVPQRVLDTYGKLQQIKANWYETQTEEMIVCKDKTLYNALLPYVGEHIGKYTDSLKYEVIKYPMMSDSYGVWGYNAKNHTVYKYLDTLKWLFYNSAGKVTAEQIIVQAQEYTDIVCTDNLLLNKYSNLLFTGEVDDGRQEGWQGTDGSGIVIDANSTFDINGFECDNAFVSAWMKMLYKGIEDNPITDIEPIYMVKDSDINGATETVAKRLLIAEDDVSGFIQTYTANKLAGKQTVIFRFAVTNYTNDEAIVFDRTESPFTPTAQRLGKAYITKQTVFLDFDIIWLKFVKEGVETVIPTVSSPMDIVSGLNPPEINDPIEWLRQLIEWIAEHWWVIVVGIIVIAIIAALIVGIVKAGAKAAFKVLGTVLWWVLKIVFYIVTLPIWLIVWGARAIKQDKDEKGK